MSPPLDDLQAFACVARHRSFRKAAQELQLTPSALSHSMSRLEQQLGMRLLHRTTRSVSATEAGELLLQQLLPALGQIDLALEQLNQKRSQPAGRLRLNVPRAALQLLLAPKLAAWSQAYPDITLEVVGNDALVDIVAEGFDAGIRFDETLQQDMVAVPLGPPIGFGVCAAPAYLQQHGVPQTPDDLLQHQCLQFRFPSGVVFPWQFARDGKRIALTTRGRLILDDLDLILQAAVAGVGIGYHYLARIEPHLASGQLQLMLQDWLPPTERLYLYYPRGRNLPAALRAFIDFFK